MSAFNTIKFSQLEKLSQINSNDFLIVESFEATLLIPASLFVLREGNVSFNSLFNSISALAVYESSASTLSLSSLSATFLNTLATQIYSLSNTISGEYVPTYYKAGFATIAAGTISGAGSTFTVNVSGGMTLETQDINLQFNTTAQPTISGEPVIAYPTLQLDGYPSYLIVINLSNVCVNDVTVSYTIRKPIR